MTTTNLLKEIDAPGITLSDVVDQFMIASFNDKRTYFLNYLFNAKIAWRELFWTTLFRVKEVELTVFRDSKGHYLLKPKDMVRLLAISVKDCNGNHHSLLLSGEVPTETLRTPDSRHCDACGSDNLCNVLDAKIITRTETAPDGNHILKTYYKTLADGTVSEVEEYLVYNSKTSTSEVHRRDKFVCSAEVNPCGCIKRTEANEKALAIHCGCGSQNNRHLVQNEFGYFNHRFESNMIRLEIGEGYSHGQLPLKMTVSYQTDADNGMEEAIVPVYAINAVIAGMAYYASLYRTTLSERDKDALRRNFNRAKEALLLFMFPFDLEAFEGLQGIMPKW